MIRALHECLMILPRSKVLRIQKEALWQNYRDGVGRKLNKKTLTFSTRLDLE